MSVRHRTSEDYGYRPIKDLEYIEYNILFIMYVLGWSDSDIDNITIDDIIVKINQTFPYIIASPKDGYGAEILTAADSILQEIHVYLTSNIRRLWHARQIVKALL